MLKESHFETIPLLILPFVVVDIIYFISIYFHLSIVKRERERERECAFAAYSKSAVSQQAC